MKKMLTVASGFQYSVNIAYDLNREDKIRNYIPTPTAMDFLQEILSSVQPASTERARVLVGAYGRGKSHMVLTALSLLLQRDKAAFSRLWNVDRDNKLEQLVDGFYGDSSPILPVIISGSNTSLTQAFIVSLQRALQDNNLMDIMPKTNYQAAAQCIVRWKQEYPLVYGQLAEDLKEPVEIFIQRLQSFDIEAYRLFEQLYPSLTAGSSFNPFLGFDVVDLYVSVAKALQARGYSGIYVVYDEFGKYLETDIGSATVSDTKMLQDFAEKCNRSGRLQMHILLICHKEIANYIDKLPKERTDGWRGVSERFKHIRLSNSFGQMYSLISQVVSKDKELWHHFSQRYQLEFQALSSRYKDLLEDDGFLAQEAYPLHPVSLYLLPRLSEKIAQNERTLFTFLSAEGRFSVPGFLAEHDEGTLSFIMPELIFDYFQPLMQKELYAGELHQIYILTMGLLEKLPQGSLEAKIVKVIGLIYMVGELDKLLPTADTLVKLYGSAYGAKAVEKAIAALIEQNYLLELKRNQGFLYLKESSGVDVRAQIANRVAAKEHSQLDKDILNAMNLEAYVYPARYNEEKEMTRYFRFEFVDGQEILEDIDWDRRAQALKADGAIYGILLENQEQLQRLREHMGDVKGERSLFVLPDKYADMHHTVQALQAAMILKQEAINDKVLYAEYGLIFQDLLAVAKGFIQSYIRPESGKMMYFYQGQMQRLCRKSRLSELLSKIMFASYGATPVINNEAVNKSLVTRVVANSRSKVIAGILRQNIERDLGLRNSGQDVAIMRSTLLRTGVLVQEEHGAPYLTLLPEKNPALGQVLQSIKGILLQANKDHKISFRRIYDYLLLPEHHIGMRQGLIPIYLAVVLHELGQNIAVSNTLGEVAVDADVLQQINESPEKYFVQMVSWDRSKEEYLAGLAELFQEYLPGGYEQGNCNQIRAAMEAWYRSLPRYSRNTQVDFYGQQVALDKIRFARSLTRNLSGRQLIFDSFARIFSTCEDYQELLGSIKEAKEYYDSAMQVLESCLQLELIKAFGENAQIRASLISVLENWYENLGIEVSQQVFADNTGAFLQLLGSGMTDEARLLDKMSMLATGLRMRDWNHEDIKRFMDNVAGYKSLAEEYNAEAGQNAGNAIESPALAMKENSYELRMADDAGRIQVKRFDKNDYTSRGRRLKNSLLARLDEAGQGLTPGEKRQIVLEVLQGLL